VHAAFISKISLGTPMREWQEMEWDFTFSAASNRTISTPANHMTRGNKHATGVQIGRNA
jgi:hypothetical protein